MTALWEDSFFPLEVEVLARNSVGFAERVRYCSHSALTIATMLFKHPSVPHAYYSALVPTRRLYERYRRPDGGIWLSAQHHL